MKENHFFRSVLIAAAFLSTSCSSDETTSSSSDGDTTVEAPFESGAESPSFPSTPSSGETSGDPESGEEENTGDCDASPGSFGCPCDSGSDCSDGYCLLGANGKICTQPCEATDCGPGWACQTLPATQCPDCPPLCIPVAVYQCVPCLGSAD